ncbi:hypothetical protein Leryth_000680 [Lithospermum erythrorhizon]|nr:hypothetical protein Leryth_000680 [Lithospermum erythrorhizon]
MAMMVQQQHRESSSGSINKHLDGSGKYVRYTSEQVEALERVYAECPKPSSLRRQQLIRECPILANIEPKQIKVWFQNRRCREKQRKESGRLHSVNRKLSAMNKLLMEENDRLQKQVSQLVCENVLSIILSLRDAFAYVRRLLSIAEETLSEFLSKATGTAVDWVQMPGMKPGPDSVGVFAISHGSSGVAARACGLVSLEPTKIVEILKDRPCWFRDCRSLEVFTMIPTSSGGTIELVYTQTYAPTTLAPARDFWTIRYTTTLENGSLVVCERSLSGTGAGPNGGAASQFVRAEMLPSGYLVRPCEGGGSIIHIVDHVNLEAWSVPEVLRPLYESSKVVAQKLTIAALRYVRQIAQETSGEVVYGLGRQPALLRTFSQRLSRGFNDAINGFNDEGWSLLSFDGAEDVTVTVNSTKSLSNSSHSFPLVGGILCAKASMLLKNVPAAVLVRFLREHRSEWADFSVDAYCAASLKAGSFPYSGMRPTRFTGSQTIMPLGHAVEHEEMCSGIDESAVGACFELVFAPIDEMFPDDAPLLPSGFRIIPLDIKSVKFSTINFYPYTSSNLVAMALFIVRLGECKYEVFPDVTNVHGIICSEGEIRDLLAHKTLDLASNLETHPATNNEAGDTYSARSILTIAFQFPVENNLEENVASMARQYVHSVILAVQRVAIAISPSQLNPAVGSNLSLGSPEALTLAHWICQSYSILQITDEKLRKGRVGMLYWDLRVGSIHVGRELLGGNCLGGESMLKNLWDHHDAILCCSLKSLPVFMFANQAGLDMMQTSLVALQDITVDKIFDDSGQKALFSEFAKIMQQGSAYLPGGICLSTMGRHVSYDQAIAWKVIAGDNESVHCLAISFVNWSFV